MQHATITPETIPREEAVAVGVQIANHNVATKVKEITSPRIGRSVKSAAILNMSR